MENGFIKLGVSPDIIKAIEEMGFVTPTMVQERTIPLVLRKEDLIVMSKTGSGKTGAFGIPMLQMIDTQVEGPQALILTPTRELAVQVDSDIKLMSKYQKVETSVVYGQHNIETEIRELKKGASIITGTPGRVFDHLQKRTLVTKNIRFLVLDEADRMLDMGFIDQVVKIIKLVPRNRITMLFSATMPTEIKRLSSAYMKEPVVVELESDSMTVDSTEQVYYRVNINEKRLQLDRLLKVEQPESCLVFCNTRYEVDRVSMFLRNKGYFVDSIHGANSQGSRLKTIEKIKSGTLQVMVATDVAARGLHIEDLNLVINYDVPQEKDSYVHRIGRTGRAGKAGKAITLVTSQDIMSLYEIEEHVNALIKEEELPTDEEVRQAISKADGKWANLKAPRPQEHISRNKNQGNAKPHQHNAAKPNTNYRSSHAQNAKQGNKPVSVKNKPVQSDRPKTVNVKPEAEKQFSPKPVINEKKESAATRIPPVEKSAVNEFKQKINRNYRPQKAYQRSKVEPPKKKTLFERVSGLMKNKK
ncbi:MAG: DEAD/DEAH box helicase [Clostridia bacterium]|nr:DEAD/DEAH box helicase [Clostridia bacterium]